MSRNVNNYWQPRPRAITYCESTNLPEPRRTKRVRRCKNYGARIIARKLAHGVKGRLDEISWLRGRNLSIGRQRFNSTEQNTEYRGNTKKEYARGMVHLASRTHLLASGLGIAKNSRKKSSSCKPLSRDTRRTNFSSPALPLPTGQYT